VFYVNEDCNEGLATVYASSASGNDDLLHDGVQLTTTSPDDEMIVTKGNVVNNLAPVAVEPSCNVVYS
jgi:hypothetical protein